MTFTLLFLSLLAYSLAVAYLTRALFSLDRPTFGRLHVRQIRSLPAAETAAQAQWLRAFQHDRKTR
jgi:hypothetical protein